MLQQSDSRWTSSCALNPMLVHCGKHTVFTGQHHHFLVMVPAILSMLSEFSLVPCFCSLCERSYPCCVAMCACSGCWLATQETAVFNGVAKADVAKLQTSSCSTVKTCVYNSVHKKRVAGHLRSHWHSL